MKIKKCCKVRNVLSVQGGDKPEIKRKKGYHYRSSAAFLMLLIVDRTTTRKNYQKKTTTRKALTRIINWLSVLFYSFRSSSKWVRIPNIIKTRAHSALNRYYAFSYLTSAKYSCVPFIFKFIFCRESEDLVLVGFNTNLIPWINPSSVTSVKHLLYEILRCSPTHRGQGTIIEIDWIKPSSQPKLDLWRVNKSITLETSCWEES